MIVYVSPRIQITIVPTPGMRHAVGTGWEHDYLILPTNPGGWGAASRLDSGFAKPGIRERCIPLERSTK